MMLAYSGCPGNDAINLLLLLFILTVDKMQLYTYDIRLNTDMR